MKRVSGRFRAALGLILSLAVLLAAVPATALADPGDPLPIAPLSKVNEGDICQARTVLKGTAIDEFDVEIVEVASFSDLDFGQLIYFEVTDPDVKDIGVASGMSGSPILCDIDGEDRVIGAISYGFSGVGPRGFATPIGDVLNGQPGPSSLAARARSNPPKFRGKRLVELGPILTVTGVPAASQGAVRKTLKRAGLGAVNFAAPVNATVPPDSPDLAPGGAFSANYVFGDVSISGICTITYRDGDRFWGCGHPIDLAGQRQLSVSGAYIFDVLGGAWNESGSFKFGAPTNPQVGTMLYDGPFAVSGRLNQTAPTIPVRLTLEADGAKDTLAAEVAAEQDLPGGSPDGFSWVPMAASMLAGKAQFLAAGQPTVQRGRVCLDQAIIGVTIRARGCIPYASSTPSWWYDPDWGEYSGVSNVVDLASWTATVLITNTGYRQLMPGALEITARAETGSGLRRLVALKPVGRFRAGRKARLRVVSADRSGRRYRQVLKFRIPRQTVRPGKRGRRVKFRVDSDTLFDQTPEMGYYLALGRKRAIWRRYEPDWGEPDPISSAAALKREIGALLQDPVKLKLDIPDSRTLGSYGIRSGGDVLVGRAVRSVFVRPARR